MRKNPALQCNSVTFTADGFRKFFDTTYDAAHDQGVRNGRALAATSDCKSDAAVDFLSRLFK